MSFGITRESYEYHGLKVFEEKMVYEYYDRMIMTQEEIISRMGNEPEVVLTIKNRNNKPEYL